MQFATQRSHACCTKNNCFKISAKFEMMISNQKDNLMVLTFYFTSSICAKPMLRTSSKRAFTSTSTATCQWFLKQIKENIMLSLKNCQWSFLSCYICLAKPLQFGNNNNNNVTILRERKKQRPIQNLCKCESCPKEDFSTHTCFPDSAAFTSAEITGLSLLVRYRVAFIAATWWRRRKKAKTKNAVIFSNIGHVSCGNLYSWAFQINSSVFHLSKKSQGSGGSSSKTCKYPRIIWCSLHKMLGTCHKAMVRMLNKNVAFSYNVKNVYLLSSSPKKTRKFGDLD